MHDLTNGYEMELTCLLEDRRRTFETKHPLIFGASSPKYGFDRQRPYLGFLANLNTMDCSAADKKMILKSPMVEENVGNALLKTSSSKSILTEDRIPTAEVKETPGRLWKALGCKEPMLCVRAINPRIFSKVPILEQALEMRMKLSKTFALIRCPAQESIQQSLGSRHYLLESNDFFSLHDLVDLSKSPFSGVGYAVEFLKAFGENVRASIYPSTLVPPCNLKLNSLDEEPALPILMEDVLKKMHIHITQLCSICYSEGKSCGAGSRCLNPSSHIFPFQDEDVIRHSCGLLYHKFCFENFSSCSCRCTDHI